MRKNGKQVNYVEETQSCKACDEVDDVYRFTVTGRGPFCSDCWEMLNDPDQSLLADDELDKAEMRIVELQVLCARAADALGSTDPKWEGDFSALIAELRKAAE